MAALGLIEVALRLADRVLEFVNTKESRKYRDHIVDLKLKINEEESHGYDADDAKIEGWHQELKVIMEAAESELASKSAEKPA